MLAALGHFCEFHGPSLVMVTQELQGEPDSRLLAAAGERIGDQTDCDGCRSLPSSSHYLVSRLPSSPRCYVSSQAPLSPALLPTLRHAVLRAVSCEVLPAKEGPLLFSSPASSSVLCHSFSLRDSRARGCRRQYSLLLVSRERHHLATHWRELHASLKETVSSLQAKAEAKYELDVRALSDLKEKCDYLRETPQGRRRASSKPSRSLREVTQDPAVFESLHQRLAQVLALAQGCLSERVARGPPLQSSVRGPGEAAHLVCRMIHGQLLDPQRKELLFRLLSGKAMQVLSSERPLARAACEGLCLLLPHNLPSSPTCFANLVLAQPGLEEDLQEAALPALRVAPGPSYTFTSSPPALPSSASSSSSRIVTKFCDIFSAASLPVHIEELCLRGEVERVLLQARVFLQLAGGDRKTFLARQGMATADQEILSFFGMFS